jgi:hypothetical protein
MLLDSFLLWYRSGFFHTDKGAPEGEIIAKHDGRMLGIFPVLFDGRSLHVLYSIRIEIAPNFPDWFLQQCVRHERELEFDSKRANPQNNASGRSASNRNTVSVITMLQARCSYWINS